MRSFKDTTGREWKLEVNVGTVKRVRDATDVLLTSLFDDKWQPLAALLSDVVKLVDVLWVVCEKQAETAGVTQEQFAESLGGDSLGKAGDALVRATADFFTSPEQRQAMHALLDKMNQMSTEFLTIARTEKVDLLNTGQLAREYLNFVTSGRGSPASTPIPEPLVN